MKNIDKTLEELASKGRYGDTMLAHISPEEAELLKAFGGSGTTNPETGLPEFWQVRVGPVSFGSDAGGISVGGYSTSDLWDTAKNTVKGVTNWAKDHPLEAAALVAAGYYYAPEIQAWMTPEGSAIVGTEAGTTAGAATLTAEEVAAEQAFQQAASQAAAENAAAGWGATGAEVTQAADIATKTGVSMKEALSYARMGLTANALLGDPLGLGGGGQQGGTSGQTGFAQVAIPEEWKSPTYAAPSAPINLESIFSNQNTLGSTQWQDLPSQRNLTFNEIFASGQQQTPMGTPVDINQIVGSILGQTATS